jgi:hypothetical protein
MTFVGGIGALSLGDVSASQADCCRSCVPSDGHAISLPVEADGPGRVVGVAGRRDGLRRLQVVLWAASDQIDALADGDVVERPDRALPERR